MIERTRAIAERAGAPVSVITFEPHPRSLFQADAPPFRLTDAAGRAEALSELGVDILFQIPSTRPSGYRRRILSIKSCTRVWACVMW